MKPTVSICIPVYNGAAYIGETLRSVLTQPVADLEVIVSDNCSTDDTVAVVQSEADERVRVVRNETNIGAIANWNRVMAASRGRFVKLLPADDVLHPGSLARQISALELPENASAIMAAGRRDIVGPDGRVLYRRRGLGGLTGLVPGGAAIRATAASGTNLFGEPAAVLVRGEPLRRSGGMTARLPYLVDLELWCRLLRDGDLFAMDETVASFRVSPGSESMSEARTQARQARTQIRELRLELPGTIRRRHVVAGAVRATAWGVARQVVYSLPVVRRG